MSDSQWIKCSNKMPEKDKKVLVYGDDGVFRAFYRCGYWICDPIGSYAIDGSLVTHWMPLPEAPND